LHLMLFISKGTLLKTKVPYLHMVLPEILGRINTLTTITFIDSPASNEVLWRRPHP